MADSRQSGGRQGPDSRGGGRQAARQRAAAARAQAAAAERRRRLLIAGGSIAAVAVILVVIILIGFNSKGSSKGTASTTASSKVGSQVTSVPAAAFDSVGTGTAVSMPQKMNGAPALTQNGKPKVVYIGAEYCPYCAAERWSVIAALSRFGTFSGLRAAESAGSPEVYPHTQTFSFHGSSYSSKYLAFEGVETQTNDHKALDTPTTEQRQLIQKYDGPPYVSSAAAGSIPFVDYGNRYLTIGATYKQDVLVGKTREQIAGALADPSTPQAKAILGSANGITAALCTLTGNKPADVCTSKGVTAASAALNATG